MRRPDEIEVLFLDFDGFFASVEQQMNPALRGRPVGVVPIEGTERTSVIAVSREAKLAGVKSIMKLAEARQLCPDLVLVPQNPDLYRRVHESVTAEIEKVIPIQAIGSIDELHCHLDKRERQQPEAIANRIKLALAEKIGASITATIGFAANRLLAKMACKAGKKAPGRYGDGLMIWHPRDMPTPLFRFPLKDIPGVGWRMGSRLEKVGVETMEQLYALQPKHMRRIWHSVTGERLWYSLHGYAVEEQQTERRMIGHGRVLPPESRSLNGAREFSRLLAIKAARRLRREDFYCASLHLSLSTRDGDWSRNMSLPIINDDTAILNALETLWKRVHQHFPHGTQVFRVSTALCDLSKAGQLQYDMLLQTDEHRQKSTRATAAIDALNAQYQRTVISVGEWKPPEGGHVGGKISFTRIPTAEDFW